MRTVVLVLALVACDRQRVIVVDSRDPVVSVRVDDKQSTGDVSVNVVAAQPARAIVPLLVIPTPTPYPRSCMAEKP